MLGIRGIVHDVYPNPGIRHFWNAAYGACAIAVGYKAYRTIVARSIYYQMHPNRMKPWKAPFAGTGQAKFL